MVPSVFSRIDTIPLTPAGKVDRKALIASGRAISTGTEYVAPGSEVERKIAEIWKRGFEN